MSFCQISASLTVKDEDQDYVVESLHFLVDSFVLRDLTAVDADISSKAVCAPSLAGGAPAETFCRVTVCVEVGNQDRDQVVSELRSIFAGLKTKNISAGEMTFSQKVVSGPQDAAETIRALKQR